MEFQIIVDQVVQIFTTLYEVVTTGKTGDTTTVVGSVLGFLTLLMSAK